MWLVLYLETVWWIKVQLIRAVCHSSFISHCCVSHDRMFGQFKHPVSAWCVADVTCRKKSWLSCRMKMILSLKVKIASFFFYLLFLWAHCCGPQYGLLKQGVECWNLHCGPRKWGLSKTDSHSFLHLNPKGRDQSQKDIVCCVYQLYSVLYSCLSHWNLMTVQLCYHQYFTPQNWVFLHVIRHHFAGVHVTVVQFTSLLDKMRVWWESGSVLDHLFRNIFKWMFMLVGDVSY